MQTGAAQSNKIARHKTDAQQAFLASGLTYEQVARRVNLSPGYLKAQLRTGCKCYITAERLRRVLGCPVEFFLPRPNISKPNNTISKSKMKERGRATKRDRTSD